MAYVIEGTVSKVAFRASDVCDDIQISGDLISQWYL